MFSLASFLIVDQMRQGKHPKDAGMEALRRIRDNTIEQRLLDEDGDPAFGINFYIINRKGEYAGVTMKFRERYSRFAVCTEEGARLEDTEPLIGA